MCNGDLGIECRGLSRRFGPRAALVDVDLAVSQGSILALLGSNGAGKTTLLRILTTLLTSTSGTARILGLEVGKDPAAVRRLIGYAPAEERSFHSRLSVMENLEYFDALQGAPPANFRDRSRRLLALLGLERHAKTRFAELSSGMKQSLTLVRALLHSPKVLLLDEPTRSLSPDRAARVWELLRRLAHDEGTCILLTTHNLGAVEFAADELAILHQGRLLVQGPPAKLSEGLAFEGTTRVEALFQHFTQGKQAAVAG